MTPGPVVVVGDLMVDVVAVAGGPLQPGSDVAAEVSWSGGGAGANVAAWLAREGVAVTLAARVGDDAPGREAVAALRAAGVEPAVTHDLAAPTGTCVVLVAPGGERTMLPDRGANLALAPGDLPAAAFTPGGHLHLSGYVLLHPGCRPAGLAALRLARRAGMTVSVDPASAAPLRACGPARVLEWADGAGVVLAQRTGGRGAHGPGGSGGCGAGAERHADEVVVTLGAGGALWTDGSALHRVPAAVPDRPVVDTTGAGDAFAAGWIAARRRGVDPEAALTAAVALATRALSRTGARPGD